jgi:biotin carboxyl carrier protein
MEYLHFKSRIMTENQENQKADEKRVTASGLHEFVVEFRRYKTELNAKYLNRKPWMPKDESKICSFIPGTILNIFVSVGQHVEQGEPLMILEAMKMKNTIFTDRAGVVKKINAVEGERVPKSKVIFELELD